jgi:hypothetical protein
MTAILVDSLVQRWLADPAFRGELRADLEGALRRAGFVLADEELAALRRVPWHLSDAELVERVRSAPATSKIW